MRYELSHDIVARQVFDKASAEAQARRKIEKYIHDRHAMYRERGALLTQDDLEYVRPHLDAIQPNAAERAFIDASERAIRRRRNRVRLTVASVMALLLAATIYSLRARGEAQRQAQQASARQLIASAGNSMEDGTLDVAGLLAREAALASPAVGASSPLLTWHLKTSRIRAYLRGHSAPVNTVAFSPDGALLATGSWDTKVVLYAASSEYASSDTLSGHTDDITALAFSPDGATLASASNDSSVMLWDIRSRVRRLEPLRGHNSEVNAVIFSPDGRLLASAGTSGEIIVWSPTDGKQVARWPAHNEGANSVAFSPDGNTLASGGGDGRVRLRNVRSSKDVWSTDVASGSVNGVVFSHDGSRVAAATRSGAVALLDARTGKLVGLFERPHNAVASALALSPDGLTLALGSWDGTVVQWDMEHPGPGPGTHVPAGSERGEHRGATLTGHTSPVLGVAYGSDGRTLASASEDGSVILWDVSERPLLHASLTRHEGVAYDVAFSADGHTLASVGSDSTVRLWTAPFEHQEPRVLRGDAGVLYSVAFSPRGDLVAAAGTLGVGMWNISGPSPQFELLQGHKDIVQAVAFSPDGQLLASGSRDSTIILWDVAKRRSDVSLGGHEDQVTGLTFSPDGALLASSSDDGRAILWRVGPQQGEAPLLGTDSPVTSVAFSPDGKTLAAGSADGLLMQWDVDLLRWRVLPRLHSAWRISDVAFAPNGRSVASSSWDGSVVIWDLARNQPRGDPLRSHPIGGDQTTWGVAFSRDGRWLAAANNDGSISVWDLSIEHLLDRACRVVRRNLSLAEWRQHMGSRRYRRTCPAAAGASADTASSQQP